MACKDISPCELMDGSSLLMAVYFLCPPSWERKYMQLMFEEIEVTIWILSRLDAITEIRKYSFVTVNCKKKVSYVYAKKKKNTFKQEMDQGKCLPQKHPENTY